MFHPVLLSPDYDIFAMLMGYVMHVDICFVLVVFLPALEMLIFPAFLYWHDLTFSNHLAIPMLVLWNRLL